MSEDVGVPHNFDRGASAGQRVAKRMEGVEQRLLEELDAQSRRSRVGCRLRVHAV
jgi:hypothetical protein